MRIQDITLVYFIEDYNQEKILYLKFKNNDTSTIFIYSNSKPNLFIDKEKIILTDKNYFNDVLGQVFNLVSTDYFIYLKPEEDIPFINENEIFIQPYYFFEINYFFKKVPTDNLIFKNIEDKILVSELRFYNKKHILEYGIENISNDDCHKKIAIDNYHYFYEKIEEKLLKKHTNILNKKNYRSDSISYLTNYNIKLFSLNKLKNDFLLDENLWINIQENFKNNNQSTEYISACLNLVFIYLSKNQDLAINQLISLEKTCHNSTLILYLLAKYYYINNDFYRSIEYLEKINTLKNNYHKYSPFIYSILKYYSFYEIGELHIKMDNTEKAIENFEKCLTNCSDYSIITKLNNFIDSNKNNIIETNFSCQTCGNCCRTKLINLTHNDTKRILDNRTDLKVSDFIDYININKNTEDYNHADKFVSENHKEMIALKKKKDKNECIFLDTENKCSINQFKPLACKAWPFVIRETDNKLMWSIHEREFIKNNCSHILIENNNISEIENTIKDFKKDRSAFFETIYKWNNYENNKNKKFIDYALKNSNKNISDYKNNINQKIIDIFSENKNIDLIEEDTFTSIYFKQTNNTFSYGLHLSNLTEFFNSENLESIKDSLLAQNYSISNQPEIYISFYINDSDTKYIVNLFPYTTQKKVNINYKSKVIFKKELVNINQIDDKLMFDKKIDYLQRRFNFIINQDYNPEKINESYNNTINTIFTLLSWLNQKEFIYLKYNLFNYLPNNFNDYLLSNTKKIDNQKEFKRFIINSSDIFNSILKLYRKYNSNLT